MAEASKIVHTDREFFYKVLGKYLRLSDRSVLDSAYNAEIKALEPRLAIKMESLQAILDELTPIDARAKNIKPQELVDSRYLDMRRVALWISCGARRAAHRSVVEQRSDSRFPGMTKKEQDWVDAIRSLGLCSGMFLLHALLCRPTRPRRKSSRRFIPRA
jgi:hypothetical protein